MTSGPTKVGMLNRLDGNPPPELLDKTRSEAIALYTKLNERLLLHAFVHLR